MEASDRLKPHWWEHAMASGKFDTIDRDNGTCLSSRKAWVLCEYWVISGGSGSSISVCPTFVMNPGAYHITLS